MGKSKKSLIIMLNYYSKRDNIKKNSSFVLWTLSYWTAHGISIQNR